MSVDELWMLVIAKRKETTMKESAYMNGYGLGEYRRNNPDYDARWDFADAAREGVFAEFKRGFEDGFDGKEAAP